jgi:putative copper export protein
MRQSSPAMSPALFLHLLLLGVWLGCLAVEGVIELAGKRDPLALPIAARLHRTIDLWVEIPAFSGVLVTGLLLLPRAPWSDLLAVKIALGCFAIAVNVACVVPVMRRRAAAERSDGEAMQRQSRWIYLAFVVGLPAGIAAFAIGVRMLGVV